MEFDIIRSRKRIYHILSVGLFSWSIIESNLELHNGGKGSNYCYLHDNSFYNDIYEDDDYDWDRSHTDDDYAAGVDDAMEDEDW